MKQKKFWIVYWVDYNTTYSEFVELWEDKESASTAAQKYEKSHEGKLKFYFEEIELIKKAK
jgi:hypothetical protein